jgi:hypothetical protein
MSALAYNLVRTLGATSSLQRIKFHEPLKYLLLTSQILLRSSVIGDAKPLTLAYYLDRIIDHFEQSNLAYFYVIALKIHDHVYWRFSFKTIYISLGCHFPKRNLSKTRNSYVSFTALLPFVNLLKVFSLILIHVFMTINSGHCQRTINLTLTLADK